MILKSKDVVHTGGILALCDWLIFFTGARFLDTEVVKVKRVD